MNSASGCEFVIENPVKRIMDESEEKKITTIIIVSDSNQSSKIIRRSVYAVVVGVFSAIRLIR